MPSTSDELDIADSPEVSRILYCDQCMRDHKECPFTISGQQCLRCARKGHDCGGDLRDPSRKIRPSMRWRAGASGGTEAEADTSRDYDSTERVLPAAAETLKAPFMPREHDASSNRITRKVIDKLQNRPREPSYTGSSKFASRFDLGAPAPRKTNEDLTSDSDEREERPKQVRHTIPEDGSPITISTRAVTSHVDKTAKTTKHSQSSLLIEYFEAGMSSEPGARPGVRVKVVPSRRKEDCPTPVPVSKPSPFMDDDNVRPRVGKDPRSKGLAAYGGAGAGAGAGAPAGLAAATALHACPSTSDDGLERRRRRRAKSPSEQEAVDLAPSSRTLASAPKVDADADASSPPTFSTSRTLHEVGDEIAHSKGIKTSINNPKLLQTVEDAIRRLILPDLKELKKNGRRRPYIPEHDSDRLSELEEHERGSRRRSSKSSNKKTKIRALLNHYFSPNNLSTDRHLQTCMDSQGFVALNVIAGFPKMQALHRGTSRELYRVLCEVAADIAELEYTVDTSGWAFVRLRDHWSDFVLPMEVKIPHARKEGRVWSTEEQPNDLPSDKPRSVALQEAQQKLLHGQRVSDEQLSQQNEGSQTEEREPPRTQSYFRWDGEPTYLGFERGPAKTKPKKKSLLDPKPIPREKADEGWNGSWGIGFGKDKETKKDTTPVAPEPLLKPEPEPELAVSLRDPKWTFARFLSDLEEHVEDEHNIVPPHALIEENLSEGRPESLSEDKGDGVIGASNESKPVGTEGASDDAFPPGDQKQTYGFHGDGTPMTVPASFGNDTSTYSSYSNPYAPTSNHYAPYSNPYAPYSSAPRSNSYAPRSEFYTPDSNPYASKNYDLNRQRNQPATLSINSYGNTNVGDRGTAILGNVYNTYYVQETQQNVNEMPEQHQAFVVEIMKLAAQRGIQIPRLPVRKDKDQVEQWVREVFEAQMCATTIWDGESVIKPPTIGSSMAYFEDDG